MHHPTDRIIHTTVFVTTSHGALAGTRNSSMGPPHEGLIRQHNEWTLLPRSYISLLLPSVLSVYITDTYKVCILLIPTWCVYYWYLHGVCITDTYMVYITDTYIVCILLIHTWCILLIPILCVYYWYIHGVYITDTYIVCILLIHTRCVYYWYMVCILLIHTWNCWHRPCLILAQWLAPPWWVSSVEAAEEAVLAEKKKKKFVLKLKIFQKHFLQ